MSKKLAQCITVVITSGSSGSVSSSGGISGTSSPVKEKEWERDRDRVREREKEELENQQLPTPIESAVLFSLRRADSSVTMTAGPHLNNHHHTDKRIPNSALSMNVVIVSPVTMAGVADSPVHSTSKGQSQNNGRSFYLSPPTNGSMVRFGLSWKIVFSILGVGMDGKVN